MFVIQPSFGKGAVASSKIEGPFVDSGHCRQASSQNASPPRGLTLVHRHYAAAGNPVANNQLSFRSLAAPGSTGPQTTTLAAGFTANIVLQP